MPRITLTARKLDSLKTDGKRVDYFDNRLPGFCVRVSGGLKSFAVFYRTGGRLRRLTLGTHPPLLLADARELAREALRSARLGSDPAANKKQERAAKTFADLAGQYIELYAKQRKRTWREDDRIITNKLNPAFGNVRAKEIKRADVRLLVDTIPQRAPIEANRTLAVCRKMYNWAVGKDLLESNPCTQISAPGQEHRRDRVLTEDEIRAIWKDLDSEEPRMAAIFRLRLMSGQRGGEVAAMEHNEVDLAACSEYPSSSRW